MIKFAIAFHRQDGLDHEACLAHWRDRHAALCLSTPSMTKHCRQYLQNELVHGGREDYPTGITTAWFDGIHGLFEHFSIPEYMTTIRPDELVFSKNDNAIVAVGEEAIPVSGGDGGHVRLFRFVRAQGRAADTANFRRNIYAPQVAAAAADLGLRGYSQTFAIKVDLPFPPEFVFDGLDEFIFETPSSAERFVDWDSDLLCRFNGLDFINGARSKTFVSIATRKVI